MLKCYSPEIGAIFTGTAQYGKAVCWKIWGINPIAVTGAPWSSHGRYPILHQFSVTAGTIFHGTRKPLKLWFEAMWHITSQKYGANALGLQRVLGLGSYNTAWKWLHRLRRAMVRPHRECLMGTVEVDETLIGGKRSGKRGRGAAGKTVVMIAVEDKGGANKKGIGRIRLGCIDDASGNSILPFIKNNVKEASTIRTDSWKGYSDLNTEGYKHITAESKKLTICHLVASLLSRWLLGTYQGAVKK